MGVSYRIDATLRIVFVNWHGVITKKEMAEHFEKMFSDKEALACGRSIADARGTEGFNVNYDDIHYLAKYVIKPLLGEKRWKTAIIAINTLQYGVGRQIQVIMEELGDISIFTDESDALKWIIR